MIEDMLEIYFTTHIWFINIASNDTAYYWVVCYIASGCVAHWSIIESIAWKYCLFIYEILWNPSGSSSTGNAQHIYFCYGVNFVSLEPDLHSSIWICFCSVNKILTGKFDKLVPNSTKLLSKKHFGGIKVMLFFQELNRQEQFWMQLQMPID